MKALEVKKRDINLILWILRNEPQGGAPKGPALNIFIPQESKTVFRYLPVN